MAKTDTKAREQRILDAAAALFAHYGYDKTAVSDIARDAGVSQGTIYLHFASKDDLLEGLIIREMQTFAENWHDRVQADPDGGTIAGMYKNMLHALNDTPFMASLFKRDRRVFGNYLRKPDNFFRSLQPAEGSSSRFEFVKLMQDAGAIRPDLNPQVIVHIMNSLAYGLVGMDEITTGAEAPSIDDLIAGIADFMDRALTPDGGGNRDAGKAIIRQIFEGTRQEFEQQETSKDEEQAN